MRTRVLMLFVALATILFNLSPAAAQADTDSALEYLKTQQNADGGFGSGFSPESSVGSTSDVILAIIAVGGEVGAFSTGGKTPLDYLAANASKVSSAGDLAKLILALVAAGQNPRAFAGVDSVARLESLIGTDGKIGGESYSFISHLLAVMALACVQRPIPDAAMAHIKVAQQEGGAWAWDGSTTTAPDTNTTAYAVQALIAAGEPSTSGVVAKALSYFRSIQNEDGGWPYQNPSDFGTTTDANSTALTLQALLAAGQDPTDPGWTKDGNTPLAALEALQNESGAFGWKADMADDNLLATVQALPAVAGKALPFATMAAGEPVAAPAVLPTSGGGLLNPALALVLTGFALALGGYALARRR